MKPQNARSKSISSDHSNFRVGGRIRTLSAGDRLGERKTSFEKGDFLRRPSADAIMPDLRKNLMASE
jgi:hypothetical protein